SFSLARHSMPFALPTMLTADRARPGGASNRVLLMVTSLSSIQQPLTDDGVGTLMLRQLRRYEFSTRRFGPGPKPDEGAWMPSSMPWMSALRMIVSLVE